MPQQTQNQPDLREMAQRLALSKGTISKVLNGRPGIRAHTRQRVLQAAKQYGYIPNRQAQVLRQGRTRCIQLQLPTLADLNYSEKMAGLYEAAARHGYDVAVTTYERDKQRRERLCRSAIAQRVEGIILMGGLGGVPLDKLQDAGIAVLMVDCGPDAPAGAASLEVDIGEGVRLLTHHLLQLGHRRPMVLTHWLNDSRYLGGLKKALREAGLPENDYVAVEGDRSPIVTEEAYKATRSAFERDRRAATAILCNNDQQAMGTIAALSDLGLSVPKDVSVTGAGNISLAQYYRPALTTMSDIALRLGEHAVEMAIAILNEECPRDIHRILTPELVIRESTGPVPISAGGAKDTGDTNQTSNVPFTTFSGGLS